MNLKLKKILIKSKKEAFSELLGNNSSKLKGEGYDFCELKEYEYGEDVKNIDWTITAKMQKPFVKVFHAQKELNITLVSILNATTHFGTKKFKQELICEIASLLAFSAIKQGDAFSSYIVNNKIESCTKKSKKMFNVNTMAKSLLEYNALNKKVDYHTLPTLLYKSIKKKSLLFLIGDFFDIKKLDLKLLSIKHEVIVIIVRDRFEEELTLLGNVHLKDLENGFDFEGVIDKSTIKTYQENVKINDHLLYEHLQKCAIDFTKIYTDEEVSSKILRLLK